MDFSARFEVFLGGWYTFDARHNTPHGGVDRAARAAADVALSNTFGPNTLTSFRVGPTRYTG
jgi:transglutaminase-like putative cysteine protease